MDNLQMAHFVRRNNYAAKSSTIFDNSRLVQLLSTFVYVTSSAYVSKSCGTSNTRSVVVLPATHVCKATKLLLLYLRLFDVTKFGYDHSQIEFGQHVLLLEQVLGHIRKCLFGVERVVIG